MKRDVIVPSTSVGIREAPLDELLNEMSVWSNRIAKRAYDFFAASGFTNGHDLDDWFKAERELLEPMSLNVKEADDEFIVTAEIPGFDAKDLNVHLNGSHLIVQGEHEVSEEKKEKFGVVSAHKVQEIYRAIELPAAVLADQARADLKNGVLELKLPKTGKPKQIKIAAA